MGSGDVVTFVPTKEVAEDSTAVITFALEDDKDPPQAVLKAAIASATIETFVESTKASIIASANALGLYNTQGEFRYIAPAATNKIQSTATPKPTRENHIVMVITNFDVAGDTFKKTRNYRLTIVDNTLVA